MADAKSETKKLSPLEQLQHDHAEAQTKRREAIDTAHEELRQADSLVREVRNRIAHLQQENLAASLAYDAKRDELIAASKKIAA